jgi:hypothetical protein
LERTEMKKLMILLMTLVTLLALSACGGGDEQSAANLGAAPVAAAGETVVEAGTVAEVEAAEEGQAVEAAQVTEKIRLLDDYSDALSVESQLAVGTLQLEETDLAVDESLAANLLPLWQALQSLSNSETAAQIEINAVINQIQDTMTAEQITAIADMRLTAESLTALQESGELTLGRGSGGARDGSDGGGGFAGGGFPGGGLPGAGRGEGGGIPGAGGSGNLSEDDIATRQAQFAEGDFGGVQDRLLTGVVIRTLQTKLGDAPERINIFDSAFTIVSEETGLSVEEIQAQTAEGATLAEIVTANGGDLEAVTTALIKVFSEFPGREGQDIEQQVFDFLNGSLVSPPAEGSDE